MTMKKPAFSRAEAQAQTRSALTTALLASVCTVFLIHLLGAPTTSLPDMSAVSTQIMPSTGGGYKNLIFYNKPPKTGSTTVRVAMKKATESAGLTAVRCFKMIDWNEMALRTLIKRDNIDFYGCHTRLTRDRFNDIVAMRGGNVTFITNTRDPSNIILSSYLQRNRHRNVADIKDPEKIQQEIQLYKKHVDDYPVDALYKYHGAEMPLSRCPYQHAHEMAMRRIAERYEAIIDLERPEESAQLVEAVTGLRPDFHVHLNERTTDMSGPMLSALAQVDTSHRQCGNQLVHKVLLQQFNIIKDRLMQNMCFDEQTGSYELCDKVEFKTSEMIKRTREEAQRKRNELLRMQ